MVTSCSAYNCNERFRKGSGISFHTFPKKPDLLRKWLVALRRDKFTPSTSSRICSKHFLPDCFNRSAWSTLQSLKDDAVPSIFDFPDHLKKPVKTRKPRTEKYLQDNTNEYQFPRNPGMRKKWIDALRRDAFIPHKFASVCSKHFSPDCFKTNGWSSFRCLKEDAVPTIFDFSEKSVKKGKSGTQKSLPKKRLIAQVEDPEKISIKACCVLGCKAQNVEGSSLHFFGFPKSKNVKNRWIEAIQRPDFEPKVHSVICSQHFVDSDYVRKRGLDKKQLKVNAIPSVFHSSPSYCQSDSSTYEPCSFNQVLGAGRMSEDFTSEPEDLFDIMIDIDTTDQTSSTEQHHQTDEQDEGDQVFEAPERISEDNVCQSQNVLELIETTRDQATQTSCQDLIQLKLYRRKVKTLIQKLDRKFRRIKKMEEMMAVMKEKIKSYELSELEIQRLRNIHEETNNSSGSADCMSQ